MSVDAHALHFGPVVGSVARATHATVRGRVLRTAFHVFGGKRLQSIHSNVSLTSNPYYSAVIALFAEFSAELRSDGVCDVAPEPPARGGRARAQDAGRPEERQPIRREYKVADVSADRPRETDAAHEDSVRVVPQPDHR